MLAVTGNPVRDFQAYAPAASAVTLNGVAVNATFSSGLVLYPAGSPPPPVDAGTPDAGAPDAGTLDAGTPDAGTPDAGTPDAGTPDAGLSDAGDPGDLCGNCQPPADGGPNPPLDAGTAIGGGKLPDTVSHGCSHAGGTIGWLAAFALAALFSRRRRNGT
jgi:MYXO-CTERM domain-containing protein